MRMVHRHTCRKKSHVHKINNFQEEPDMVAHTDTKKEPEFKASLGSLFLFFSFNRVYVALAGLKLTV